MTFLVLIRHGPTEWNARKLVQGRGDVALSHEGRSEVARWRVPAEFAAFEWVTSPLSRAVETARLLGARDPAVDPRLVEMDWGEWEGRHLDDLRRQLGDPMTAWEAKGLDFRAPAGESPREVQARLRPFLAARATLRRDTVAVAHKGVIRAVYALAVGWDMTAKPPHKLRDAAAQVFRLAPDGTPALERANVPLAAGGAG